MSDNSKTLHFCRSVLASGCFCWFWSLEPGFLVCLVTFHSAFCISLTETCGSSWGLVFSFAAGRHTPGTPPAQDHLKPNPYQPFFKQPRWGVFKLRILRAPVFDCRFSKIYFILVWFFCLLLLSTNMTPLTQLPGVEGKYWLLDHPYSEGTALEK